MGRGPVILPHIRAGALTPLALAARTRSPALPDLPTTGEFGFPRLLAENWYCMVGPAQLPAAIRARLSAAVREAGALASVRDGLAAQGAEAAWTSEGDFAALVREESETWRQVARSANVRRSSAGAAALAREQARAARSPPFRRIRADRPGLEGRAEHEKPRRPGGAAGFFEVAGRVSLAARPASA